MTEETLRPQVQAWLSAASIAPGLKILVEGSPIDARVVAFVLRDQERVIAQRSFDPGPFACTQLEATLALAIALALKVSLLQELAPTRPTGHELAASLTGLALLGFAPHVPLGAQLVLDAALGERASLRAGMAFWSATGNPLPRAAGSFDLRNLALRIDGCAKPLLALAWSLHTCVGARIGGLWAHGEQLATNLAAREAWVALSAEAEVLLPVSPRWSLALSGALLASLVRSRFEVRTRSEERIDAFTVPIFAGELSAGPRVSF